MTVPKTLQHLSFYPDHAAIHATQLKEITMSTPIKWTERDAIALVNLVKAEGLTYTAAADRLGIPRGSLNTVMNKLPEGIDVPLTGKGKSPIVKRDQPKTNGHAPEPGESLRSAILAVVNGSDGKIRSTDLPRLLKIRGGRTDSLHSIQHVIGSLARQGLVGCREARGATGGKFKVYDVWPINRPPARMPDGDEAWRSPDPQVQEPITLAVVPDPEIVAATPVDPPSDPTPVVEADPAEREEFPLLDAIMVRAAEADEVDRKVTALMNAAESLTGIDDAAVDQLLERALAAKGVNVLSPLELEYLRFAKTHGGAE